MEDVLSDVLQLIRLKSCVYFLRDFCSPWAMRIDGTAFAQFHVIVRGQCVVQMDGTPHSVAPGDVLLFPRGSPHVLADREGRQPVPGREVTDSSQYKRQPKPWGASPRCRDVSIGFRPSF